MGSLGGLMRVGEGGGVACKLVDNWFGSRSKRHKITRLLSLTEFCCPNTLPFLTVLDGYTLRSFL